MAYKRLGDLLIAAGTITPEELEHGTGEAEKDQGTTGNGTDLSRNHHRGTADRSTSSSAGYRIHRSFENHHIPISMAQVVPKNIAKAVPGSAGPHGAGRALSGHERPYELLCNRGS